MKLLNGIIQFILVLLLLPFAEPRTAHAQSMANSSRTGNKGVEVVTRQVDDHFEVLVQNRNPYDITLTLNLSGENYRPSIRPPIKKVFPPNSTTAAVKIYRAESGKSVRFKTNYSWFMGDIDATHNDAYIYALPFERGKAFRIGQGPNGSFSHSGKSKYAIDFIMPIGTPVYAVREGVVISIKEDANRGGPSKRFMEMSNFVIIRHDDGTLGEYAHLKQNGVLVNIGDFVYKGDRIGLSGNTGYSSGPHLHFMVTKITEDGSSQSIPFRFRASRGIITRPVEGVLYRAN